MRLVEILKQRQYEPLSIEVQVVIIFSGIGGFLDAMPINQISKFVDHLINTFNVKYQNLINVTSNIDKEAVALVINEAKNSF